MHTIDQPIKRCLLLLIVVSSMPLQQAVADDGAGEALSDRVLIRRTQHGIPHIYADDLRAAGFALGYAQMEDHAERVTESLLRARGAWAQHQELAGDELQLAISNDAVNQRLHRRAADTWPQLSVDTRDFVAGFALGVNRYIRKHADAFAGTLQADFTAYDVHARNITEPNMRSVGRFLETLRAAPPGDDEASAGIEVAGENRVWANLAANVEAAHVDAGSNAWALAPQRTTSGKAILLRNPHLSWTAGYYEAHLTVPGKLDFYGDFRVGSALGIIGGFNRQLGFATTNNNPDLDDIYALTADPLQADHYLLDGASRPLDHELVTVRFRNGAALSSTTREFWSTPFGPVVHREGGKIYVLKAAGEGEFRVGEQFLRMMQASNLDEWTAAMRMRARVSSNLTYADAAGNIFYVWNATMPARPHAACDDCAIAVSTSAEMWQEILPWEALPQLLNPPGGYLRNENDSFHFTNLNAVLEAASYPAYFPEPRLRLRSQHSLELLHNDRQFSLEDVVAAKHSMRMLLAARVKGDLLRALDNVPADAELMRAIQMIRDWDNTASRTSRGSVLFEAWWNRYVDTADPEEITVDDSAESVGYAASAVRLFREPWSAARPLDTPFGLADPQRAVAAFLWAINETRALYGSWDLSWGDVHRARLADVDVPVGGCTGLLGCFRVLWFDEKPDDNGQLTVRGGDGWVLAVEFAETPRAYSVLAYGQSSNDTSPHRSDQLAAFADNRMTPVVFSEADVKRATIREYRPGAE